MNDQLVVKVGGSLYDLPELGPRLIEWLGEQGLRQVLLVPGGGAAADLIRTLDRTHHLGEAASHWLALRMLQTNAHFLAQILLGATAPLSPVLGGEGPGVRGLHVQKLNPSPQPLSPEYRGEGLLRQLQNVKVVASPRDPAAVSILDAFAFAQADEVNPGHLPHVWDATSDSIALRVAQIAAAPEVVLLKSVAWDSDDWEAAARLNIVDAHFPHRLREMPEVTVRVVNLRTWQPRH